MMQVYENIEYQVCDHYSYKDFTNSIIPEDLSGRVIYGSFFYNETLDAEIFSGAEGTTFIKCDLRNIKIPESAITIDCRTERLKVQNDGNEWLVDDNNDPVKPAIYDIIEKLGLEVPTPEVIPDEPAEEPIDLIALARGEG